MYNPVNGGECQQCPKGTISSDDRQKCHPVDLFEQRANMFDMEALQRFDLMCSKLEHMHNCESENSTAIGPIKVTTSKSLHEQPIFYFTYDGPLQELESIEFLKNKSSPISENSFIYMLVPRQHLSLRDIHDYLQDDKNSGRGAEMSQYSDDFQDYEAYLDQSQN